MSAELECLSCGATVSVVPYVAKGGQERVGGRCASCQLIMTAEPNVLRESHGYYVRHEVQFRVDYTRGRFGDTSVRVKVRGVPIPTTKLHLLDVARDVLAQVRRKEVDPADYVSEREAKRRARALRQ